MRRGRTPRARQSRQQARNGGRLLQCAERTCGRTCELGLCTSNNDNERTGNCDMSDAFGVSPGLPRIFDGPLLLQRRLRALRLGPETFLLDRVADDMADRLRAVLRRFGTALDLSTPTSAVRTALAGGSSIDTFIAADALFAVSGHNFGFGGDRSARSIQTNAPVQEHDAKVLAVAADVEALPFANASLDLV